MPTQAEKATAFRDLHERDGAFVIPNPWDVGSAKMLAGLGFEALATTSSGFAMTLGRNDYKITREEKLAHCRALTDAVDLPISGDLEKCFADDPAGVAETIKLVAEAGLVGGSVEDATQDADAPIFPFDAAVARVAAAVEAARALPFPFILTARAEGLLHGGEFDDVIARLKAFEAAGADVLYAPGLRDLEQIKTVCSAVSKPVNVLNVFVRDASVADMAAAGAKRISVGAGLARAAAGEFLRAAEELRDAGTHTFVKRAARGEMDKLLAGR
ncbi:MAG: isocitrate lyase/phosphoenolpyruvate mutase family protein [Pseudomonadota bacterium]